jgi:hypothetical protein
MEDRRPAAQIPQIPQFPREVKNPSMVVLLYTRISLIPRREEIPDTSGASSTPGPAEFAEFSMMAWDATPETSAISAGGYGQSALLPSRWVGCARVCGEAANKTGSLADAGRMNHGLHGFHGLTEDSRTAVFNP